MSKVPPATLGEILIEDVSSRCVSPNMAAWVVMAVRSGPPVCVLQPAEAFTITMISAVS